MLFASAAMLCSAGAVALLVDGGLGEPPVRWHPVVWMGNYLATAGSWVQRRAVAGHAWAFVGGALAWTLGALVVLVVSTALQYVLWQLPWMLGVGVLGVLLKPLLAWSMLKSEVRAVEAALAHSTEAGRARLRYLVSRSVDALDSTEVRESAIESLAENFNDSVIAPLCWFVLLGLPGAALFRYANTADAMWGYRGHYQGRDWFWAGKWAARVDDVLCWVPARVSALLLLLAGRVTGQRARRLRAEAGRTPSPNSGWPMAAMAIALDVRLCKPGVYVLQAQGRAAGLVDTQRALRLGDRALVCFALAAALTLALGTTVQHL